MASKPNKLELQVLQSSMEKVSLNGLSPPSPNTPTICLSAPKGNSSPNGFSFPSRTNHGFIVDEESSPEYGANGYQERNWNMPGVLDTVSMSSMLSMPTAAVAGTIALSPGSKSLQTVPRSQTQDTMVGDFPTLHNHSHSGTNGSNSSLTIPQFGSNMSLNKRHNSLPTTDTHLSPGFLLPKYPLKERKSLDGLNCISNTFDMSQLPFIDAWGKKPSSISRSNSVISSSDGSFSLECDDSHKTERFHKILKTVVSKANKMRKNKVHPGPLDVPLSKKRKRLDSFAPSSCVDETVLEISFFSKKITVPKWLKRLKNMKSIDPSGSLWLTWLFVVSMAFVYNAFTIFLRGVFGYDNHIIDMEQSFNMWLSFDLIFDGIYLLDILFRTRIQFIDGGLYVEDKKLTRKNYFASRNVKFDVVCLLPFDLFSKIWMDKRVLIFLRLPRLLKYHCYNEFVSRFENSSSFANAFRVGKMVSYLLYMIHLNTCCYYAISLYEGLGINDWVYREAEDANPYIRCMFRATKTLITIGNLPKPHTDLEIVFMNIDFAIGIFVFASIIGQMRDIVGAASATKERFRERMDNTMLLLNNWHIPEHVQKKVRMWYMYKWDSGELIDEADILSGVPLKMQIDIAIHVHLDTLTKVSLFQDCDKMLLRDLMLKLRPVLFLPGDFICRKGEVGKEMYIIKSGQVQVLGGGKVLATLHGGSVFGEISLLSLSGGNRRTADVYSPGYANLFVLDKKTLQETLVNYPEAQELLQEKANAILKKNEENGVGEKKKKRGKSLIAESILIADKAKTPRFFNAVLSVARERKLASMVLKGGMSMDLSDEDNDCAIVDDEVQKHRDAVAQDEPVSDDESIEPNVVVHQPPTGMVGGEDLGSHIEDNLKVEQSTVLSKEISRSSTPDQLQQRTVVKKDVKEGDSPSIQMEQSNTAKEIGMYLKPNSTPAQMDQSIVSEGIENYDSSSLKPEQFIRAKEFEKSGSTCTQIEHGSPCTQIERDSACTQIECDSPCTQIERDSACTQIERDSACTQIERDSACTQIEKDSACTKIECDSACTKIERDSACTKIERDSACTQIERDSACTPIERDSACTQIEYDSPSTQIERDSACTPIERDSACTQIKCDSPSTQIERDSACTQIESDSACTPIERDSPSTQIERDSACTQIKCDSPSTQIERDSACTQIEKDSACTPIECNSPCTQIEHDSGFTQIDHDPCTQIEEHDSATSHCKPLRKNSTHIEIEVAMENDKENMPKDFPKTQEKEAVEDRAEENKTEKNPSVESTASPETKCYQVIENELDNQRSGVTESIEADQYTRSENQELGDDQDHVTEKNSCRRK